MNREIKFRFWNKIEKKMYNPNTPLELNYGLIQDKTINGFMDEHEVMQFTGLKDKNGKEIYEGDILKIGNCTREVFWGNTGWELRRNEDLSSDYSLFEVGESMEVIGNIWENPELLATKKEGEK